jgi:hypothetical protein
VSSSGTALAQVGIANAFRNAANLEALSTGVALATTPAGNGTVPQAEINTLANVLAGCVDSNGTLTLTSGCFLLFVNSPAEGTSGPQPTETATAAINIAHYPAANVSGVDSLSGRSAVYAPALIAQPNDWTIGLTFTGGGLNYSSDLAIDAAGDVWIANYHGSSVVKLSNLGTVLSGASGYAGGGISNPTSIAIDGSGNAWVADESNRVVKLSSSGIILSGTSGYTGGGLNSPDGIAIGGLGNAWVANTGGNGVVEVSSSGSVLSGTAGYTGGGLSSPGSIAVDGSGNAWVANILGSSVVEVCS